MPPATTRRDDRPRGDPRRAAENRRYVRRLLRRRQPGFAAALERAADAGTTLPDHVGLPRPAGPGAR